jgi:hypothetical protein
MDRRKALKNIGTGIGAIAVTPTVVSLFQSCQTATGYTPVFIPQEDFGMVSNLMELIIPATDTPGAIELKLPEFLDAYVDGVWSQEDQARFAEGWTAFKSSAVKASGKENASQLTLEDWDAQLANYLKSESTPSEDDAAAAFADQLRGLTVNAFKTNEYIGENVLAYAPIPGDYKGCVDLQETTGGKAWSL